MAIDEHTQLGRAKNALLSLLERRLSVPKIYFDANWAGTNVEVLAIDRDGVGDVHAILLFARPALQAPTPDLAQEAQQISHLLGHCAELPAQYKYIAAVDVTELGSMFPFQLPEGMRDHSFSPDGLGRVGFIAVEVPREYEPKATVIVRPERFRALVASLADEYIHQHSADWEIRA